MDGVSWSDWTGQHCMCVPPSGATLFKSIKQASPSVQVNKQTAGRPLGVCTLSSTTHPGQNTQGTAETCYSGVWLFLSPHPTRETHTLLATLAGSSSHFQAVTTLLPLSAGLMRILQTLGSHFGSTLWTCIRLRRSILHKTSHTPDTRHLRPPMNYTEALRNASGLAFMGVQIWAHFLINDWGARGGFMCVQSDAAWVLNIDDRNEGGVWWSLQEEGNNSRGLKALEGQKQIWEILRSQLESSINSGAATHKTGWAQPLT